jgi:hypothetical protein
MEEGFMLVFPRLVQQGWVPNVDFLHLYGPTSLDVLALWYRVFGDSLESQRTFGLLQHLGIILASTRSPVRPVRRCGRRRAGRHRADHDADRALGARLARRAGARVVGRGVRRPRAAAARPIRDWWWAGGSPDSRSAIGPTWWSR